MLYNVKSLFKLLQSKSGGASGFPSTEVSDDVRANAGGRLNVTCGSVWMVALAGVCVGIFVGFREDVLVCHV